MSDTPSKKETEQQPTEKKKGLLGKLKESVDEREEQLAILSTFVRLGILVWSGGILTLAYIATPPAWGIPEQKLDPTFIASVFTGVLATFGVQAAKGKNGSSSNGVTAAELKTLIEAAAQVAPSQTIRLEHAPLVIAPSGYTQPPTKS
jgi:hypothetical protein|tara:strand:- start:1064 stop:1507 length:444 start_codon:yes stop_codon:yes gene_type:complete